ETEAGMVINSLQRAMAGDDVISDFCGMYFQTKLHALFLEDIHNRLPLLPKLLVAPVDFFLRRRWEEIELVPDGTAREAIDNIYTKLACGARRILHLLGRPFAHPVRIAVTPNAAR